MYMVPPVSSNAPLIWKMFLFSLNLGFQKGVLLLSQRTMVVNLILIFFAWPEFLCAICIYSSW